MSGDHNMNQRPVEALRAALAQPAEQEPKAFGVLFAVEQATRNGDCPWQIEQAFHEYEAERKNGIGEQT